MTHSLTVLDLFSGIGGFSYAAERLVGGFQTIAFCEADRACQRVLGKHWPNTPIFPDVCTLTAQDIQPLCPTGLDVITAGFPCQDLSVAGKQAGYDGKRSVLFYEIIRLARELRPDFLLLENVRNLLSHQNGETFQETLFQIAQAGYDAEWAVIPASDVGACHRRERIWIIAHASSGASQLRRRSQPVFGKTGKIETKKEEWEWSWDSSWDSSKALADAKNMLSNGGTLGHGRQFKQFSFPQFGNSDGQNHAADANNTGLQGQRPECELPEGSGEGTRPWRSGGPMLSPEWGGYISKPVLCRGDDGLSGRVDRLKQLGNSIVPQVAAIPLRRIKELAFRSP